MFAFMLSYTSAINKSCQPEGVKQKFGSGSAKDSVRGEK